MYGWVCIAKSNFFPSTRFVKLQSNWIWLIGAENKQCRFSTNRCARCCNSLTLSACVLSTVNTLQVFESPAWQKRDKTPEVLFGLLKGISPKKHTRATGEKKNRFACPLACRRCNFFCFTDGYQHFLWTQSKNTLWTQQPGSPCETASRGNNHKKCRN